MANRSRSGKTKSKEDVPKVKTVKLTLTVPETSAKRFGVHAEMLGLSKGELFTQLIEAGCKRFVVSDRDKPADGQTSPTE